MKMRLSLLGAAAALSLGLMAAGAQAAPGVPGASGMKAAATEGSNLQDVRWYRRCWWHHGHRHCRRTYRRYGYYPYWSGYDPGYYGPSFGFSFGGFGRHHHHHHH